MRRQERRTSSPLNRFLVAMVFSKDIWLVYTASFLCGRASLGHGIYPFGVAFFWTVLMSGRRPHAIAALPGLLFGMSTVAPVHRLLAVAAVTVGGLFFEPGPAGDAKRASGWQTWLQAFGVAAAHLFSRIMFARALVIGWESPVWLAIEAMLIATTIVVWHPLAELWSNGLRGPMSRRDWVSAALFAVMLSLGLVGLGWGPVYPAELWNRVITLVGALIGGASGGAAVGTALAWITGIKGVTPIGGPSVYALSGLLGGLFAARGKASVGVGFLLGHLLLSIQTPSAQEIVYGLIHALLAMACLVLVPNGWLRSLERALPGSRARERFTQVREDRLRAAVSERLTKMSGLLAEMGRTFAVVSATQAEETQDAPDVRAVVQKVFERLCTKCPGYRKCWEDHLYQTYKEMAEFIRTGAEGGDLHAADIPYALRQRCFRVGQLTQTAHAVLSEVQERISWYKRLEAQAHAVPAQLQGIAALLESLADQVRVETGGADEIQVLLADALHEARVPVTSVQVRPLGASGRYDILIERSAPCDRTGLWRDEVSRVVCATLRRDYAVWHETCGEQGRCTLRFAERPPHSVEQASVVLAKDASGVCGDTVRTVELIDGRVAVVLSDGMGSGAQAALQSESAAQLLGTLLETGFDLRTAVRSVNSLLLMRSTEETFATIDAVVIDPFTGVAEFLKVGSAPTFIVRGGKVSVIRSTTLPVGIVQQVDARIEQRRLLPGDTIVLLTDGLLDSVSRGPEQEEWLVRLLESEAGAEPKQLLDTIIARVSQAAGGAWRDDVTVAALRFGRRAAQSAAPSRPEPHHGVG